MNPHARKSASSVAASILANEVNARRRRYAPTDTEAHAITDELANIVAELRLRGVAGEPIPQQGGSMTRRRSRPRRRSAGQSE